MRHGASESYTPEDDDTEEAGIAHPCGTESGRIRVRLLSKCNNLPTVL